MFKRTPKKRSAGVFLRKGELLFQPDHQTIHGVYIGASPILKLGEDAANGDVGIALLETLQHARSGVPHPEDWSKVPQPLWPSAGVKSWATFVKGSLNCHVVDDGTQLRLTPSHNAGARDGFQHLNEKALTLPSTSPPEQIGAAIREALARSD